MTAFSSHRASVSAGECHLVQCRRLILEFDGPAAIAARPFLVRGVYERPRIADPKERFEDRDRRASPSAVRLLGPCGLHFDLVEPAYGDPLWNSADAYHVGRSQSA